MNEETTFLVKAYGGDLNCAFNGFALGLCNLAIQGKFNNDKGAQYKIIELFGKAGIEEVKTFDQIKTYLTEQNTEEKLVSLQKALAKQLRTEAGDYYYNLTPNKKGEIKNSMLQSFLAAYDDYIGDPKIKNKDDIYRQHKFIVEEFERLKHHVPKLTEEKLESSLSAYWMREGGGFDGFVGAMLETGTYAGDIELAILGRKYGIDVIAVRGSDMKTSLTDNKDKNFPSIILRNEYFHWNYEADEYPRWLASLVEGKSALTPDEEKKSGSALKSKVTKWERFADEKVRNILKETFVPGDKDVKQIDVEETKAVVTFNNRDNVTFGTTSDGTSYETRTDSTDVATLQYMVDKMKEVLTKLGRDPVVVEIESDDPEVAKELERLCKDARLVVKKQPENTSKKTQVSSNDELRKDKEQIAEKELKQYEEQKKHTDLMNKLGVDQTSRHSMTGRI